MSKMFRKGRKYVFTKKKFIQQCKSQGDNWKLYRGWVNECNGQLVQVHGSATGFALGYSICPYWCKEVK